MINQFDTIANRLPDILNRITSAKFANKDFDTEKPLPYHDNRIKLIVPLDRNTDITITLTRTRAGKRINYNPDEILKYTVRRPSQSVHVTAIVATTSTYDSGKAKSCH